MLSLYHLEKLQEVHLLGHSFTPLLTLEPQLQTSWLLLSRVRMVLYMSRLLKLKKAGFGNSIIFESSCSQLLAQIQLSLFSTKSCCSAKSRLSMLPRLY